MQRQQLEVGEDYAVVLTYPRFGTIDPRRIETYVKYVGRCRLISKRSGKNGLVFALVDDYRRPESGALTPAGEEIATKSARDVICSWSAFEVDRDRHETKKSERDAAESAARGRHSAIRTALARVGAEILDPPDYRHTIDGVSLPLDEAEKVSVAIDGLGEIEEALNNPRWDASEKLRGIGDILERVVPLSTRR